MPQGKQVTEYPGFKRWVADHTEDIAKSRDRGKEPYFVRDNARDVTSVLNGESTVRDVTSSAEIAETGATATEPTDAKKVKPYDGLSESMQENYAQLEKELGIECGQPMTFEDANELRGNPHFAENEQYRVNCQSCVVAHELRRRGFDVQAIGNTKGSMPEMLSYATNISWIDDTGATPKKGVVKPYKSSTIDSWGRIRDKYKSAKEMNLELASLTATPGRYHVDWNWKGRNDGHIITLEVFSDGSTRFYDPQNGKIVKWSDYAGRISYRKPIRVLRVDNLRVNPDVAKGVLTKAGTPAAGAKATKATAGTAGSVKRKWTPPYKAEREYNSANGGNATMPVARFDFATANKQEFGKYEKEWRMAKTFANNGHSVSFNPSRSGYDVIIDGVKADLKSTKSAGNIVNYAKEAVRKQGAEVVLFEFGEFGSQYIEELQKLSNIGIHGKYYIKGESKIHSF